MGNKVGAILLDTRSIQRYVFGCNELKTNVGASFIVDNIFNELMCGSVLKGCGENVEVNWKENTQVKMLEKMELEYEAAYIGGGNMLLLVRVQNKSVEENLNICRKLVRQWSKKLLLYAPGLKTGAAVGVLDISQEGFKESLNALYKQLKENQSIVLPNVDLPCTGLTKECDVSGKTADSYDYSIGEKRMVSAEVKAKIDAYEPANRIMCSRLEKLYPNQKYAFVDDFNKLGYKEGESYLAVVHIDGNNMGVKFSCCDSINERKQLSLKVQGIVEKAFEALLHKMVRDYEGYPKFLDAKVLQDGDVRLLPIRPLIMGGDDITFVCPGRLGIELAKYFVEEASKHMLLTDEQHALMEKSLTDGKTLSKTLSCCAGVAIVPAKYPFFRAYELAEQLCGSAKKYSRNHDDSWLDFAILHGEMSSALEQLRKQQYTNYMGKLLHFGPYKVGGAADFILSIERLLSLSDSLNVDKQSKGGGLSAFKKKAAQNKVKKLREVLCGDMHGIIRYLENSEDVEAVLQKECGREDVTAADFWQRKPGEDKEYTRFIDAIEIMDFLPIE